MRTVKLESILDQVTEIRKIVSNINGNGGISKPDVKVGKKIDLGRDGSYRKPVQVTSNVIVMEDSYRKGFHLPEHSHCVDEVIVIQKGCLECVTENESLLLKTGDFLIIPAHDVHSIKAVENSLFLSIYSF